MAQQPQPPYVLEQDEAKKQAAAQRLQKYRAEKDLKSLMAREFKKIHDTLRNPNIKELARAFVDPNDPQHNAVIAAQQAADLVAYPFRGVPSTTLGTTYLERSRLSRMAFQGLAAAGFAKLKAWPKAEIYTKWMEDNQLLTKDLSKKQWMELLAIDDFTNNIKEHTERLIGSSYDNALDTLHRRYYPERDSQENPDPLQYTPNALGPGYAADRKSVV